MKAMLRTGLMLAGLVAVSLNGSAARGEEVANEATCGQMGSQATAVLERTPGGMGLVGAGLSRSQFGFNRFTLEPSRHLPLPTGFSLPKRPSDELKENFSATVTSVKKLAGSALDFIFRYKLVMPLVLVGMGIAGMSKRS